ncbi:PAP2 superfamily protein [Yasminevirus sp. GU-2018]|uniref:PAP2 superfamily protein n=1 Tax=Yasminevirus sp. GU-2018 TaxID=2420051 RepID=A0A5K0U6L7_9VIRU|nr:PAP2 superfamily protein [Yasminevirus sp. GU-2018]
MYIITYLLKVVANLKYLLFRIICSVRDTAWVVMYPYADADCFDTVFKKGLIQSSDKRVTRKNVRTFYKAVENNDLKKLVSVVNPSLKVVDPLCFYSKQTYGPLCNTTVVDPPHSYSSREFALNMLELYFMYLMRDVKFSEWSSYPIYSQCMDLMKSHDKKTRFNLRMNNKANNINDNTYYVSQFLLQPVPYWQGGMDNKIKPYKHGSDTLTTIELYEQLHHYGVVPTIDIGPEATRRYIVTGRDLATMVHKDHPIQVTLGAYKLLNGVYPESKKIFNKTLPITPFVDNGQPLIELLITMASMCVLRSAWYHKYHTFRVLRPEEFGYNVEKEIGKFNDVVLDKNNVILKEVNYRIGSHLLPGVYPEGCPAHPSFPSGHAVLAGAGITIIKAFFDEDYEIPHMIPNSAGDTLETTSEKVKVGDELNKLAFNMAFGRNWAGIHYRMDAENGIKLGEHVAISILRDYVKGCNAPVKFTFRSYFGDKITI